MKQDLFLTGMAMIGYPVWASDTGGYWGGFSRETATRWFAFGCFSPVKETGPTYNRGFWNNRTEPHYDTKLIAVWRLYSIVRTKLMEYVERQARKAHDDGTPEVRPLFLAFPEQEESLVDWQTYMLGPDLLVPAVRRNGITEHQVWLPAGETWIDARSEAKEEYDGGTYVTVEVPACKVPLFIRKGSDPDPGDPGGDLQTLS
jgi:alpha-D-xyloside xylohydrolase